jgi:hypothetical protein
VYLISRKPIDIKTDCRISPTESLTTNREGGLSMQSKSPAIFINDDEVEFKVIYVYSDKSKKMRKYTITEAERLGLVRIDSGSFQMGGDSFSKAVDILDRNVKLCLSTKGSLA